MRSRITKLGAAAVMIVAVLFGIYQFGGAPDIASTAFARVRATVNDVSCMHLLLSTRDNERGDRESEFWLLPERKIIAGTTNSGVYWRNYLNRQRKMYERASNTLTIYYERDELSYENGRPWNYLSAVFGPELVSDLNVTQYTEESHGERLNVYEFVKSEDGRTSRFKIVAGTDDNLPRTISIEAEDTEKGSNFFVEGACRYPGNGPEDIYDLGVPKDATVIDNLPTVEAKELIDICNAYRENFSSYVVIVMTGSASRRSFGIEVNYIDGNTAKAGRFFKYLHYFYAFPSTDRDFLEKEIENGFDSLLDRIKNTDDRELLSASLWDGKYRHLVGIGEDPSYRKVRGLGGMRDVCGYAWPIVLPMGEIFQNEYSEQNNLIGLKTAGSLYYFAPEHDYICVRRNDGRLIRDVRELARTENGSWYPRRIELTLIERDTDGAEISRQVTNVETIFVKMVSEFPEATFDPDNLPRTIE